jgi:hypothetical protein
MTPTQQVTIGNAVAGAIVGAAFGYAYFTNLKLERQLKQSRASLDNFNTQMSNFRLGQPMNLI